MRYPLVIESLEATTMDKKISALKFAYAVKDAERVRRAAAAVIAHNHKHPFATMLVGPAADEIVRLAKRIVEAPVLPF